MAFILDLTKPYAAFYSVPAAFMLVFLPHVYGSVLAGKNANNAYPRTLEENILKDKSLDKATVRRIQRAKAAAANGFESIGMYAASIAAAATAGVPVETLNSLALSYIASRFVFVFTYVILQENNKFAGLRSLVWIAGVGIIFALWIKAGNAAAALI